MTLEELYRVNRDLYVKKYTMKTGSMEDAEDIVQEAFTVALEYFESFDETKAELSVWFSTVLHNCWRRYQRDKRDSGLVRDEEYNVEEFVYSNILEENLPIIEALLKTKNGTRNEVLHLHYHLGYTPKEIQYFVDINNQTIRNYIREFNKEVEEMFN